MNPPHHHGRLVRALTTLAIVLSVVVVASCSDGTGNPVPSSIRFASEPTEPVAGAPFSATVELVDGSGQRIGGGNSVVAVTLDGAASLSGATAVTSLGGLATFDDLVVTRAGTGYRLNASAAGRSVVGAPFAVRPAAPSLARSGFSPGSALWFEGTSVPLEFSFTDAFGNALANLPVTLSSSLGGSTLNPATGTTSPEGVFETRLAPGAAGVTSFAAQVGTYALQFNTPFAITEFCRTSTLAVPGVAVGSLPGTGVCDANGRPAAVFRVSQPTTRAIAVGTTASFVPRVEMRTDLGEPAPQFLPSSQSPTVEWLVPPGEYLFRISAQAGTGAYTLNASSNDGNDGVAARAIISSGTYAGQSLRLTDRDFGDGTVYDYFLLFSVRSCTITMRSTELDAYLWAEDAIALQFLVIDDNSAGGTDARVTLTPCNRDGNPIGVFANSNPTPQLGPQTGVYSLTVEFGPLPTTAAAGVEPAPAAIGASAMRSASARVTAPRRIPPPAR